MITATTSNSVASGTQPYIAKWFNNQTAAVSLRFDDSLESQVEIAVPILNEYRIPGTFMINPGRDPYQKHKRFWEEEIPRMQHKLGNHTWHHKGAENLEEADNEIGSVSRLIWGLYPGDSKLLVFASGGGVTWGGEKWKNADDAYKVGLVSKYHLIDLYDGHHTHLDGYSKNNSEVLCEAVDKAIANKEDQAFAFHRIGTPFTTFKGIAATLLQGREWSFSEENFRRFVEYITAKQEIIWIAPLADILKYETERQQSSLKILKNTSQIMEMQLSVNTDSALYDHPLTIVLPFTTEGQIRQHILEKQIPVARKYKGQDQMLINVRPVASRIVIERH